MRTPPFLRRREVLEEAPLQVDTLPDSVATPPAPVLPPTPGSVVLEEALASLASVSVSPEDVPVPATRLSGRCHVYRESAPGWDLSDRELLTGCGEPMGDDIQYLTLTELATLPDVCPKCSWINAEVRSWYGPGITPTMPTASRSLSLAGIVNNRSLVRDILEDPYSLSSLESWSSTAFFLGFVKRSASDPLHGLLEKALEVSLPALLAECRTWNTEAAKRSALHSLSSWPLPGEDRERIVSQFVLAVTQQEGTMILVRNLQALKASLPYPHRHLPLLCELWRQDYRYHLIPTELYTYLAGSGCTSDAVAVLPGDPSLLDLDRVLEVVDALEADGSELTLEEKVKAALLLGASP